MNKKRIIPLFIPFILLVLSESFIIYPSIFFVSISVGLIFILFSLRYLAKNNEEKFWPSYLVLPAFIWIGFSSFAFLSSNQFLVQLVLFSISVLIFVYYKNIYYYLFAQKSEKENNLDNFAVNYSFLIVFSLYFSFYTLPLFINISFNSFFFFLALILFILFWQTMLFLKEDINTRVTSSLISALFLGELSWILFMIPLKASVLAFVMAIVFYFVSTILRLNIKNNLNKKSIKWPLAVSTILLVLVLLSAPWI